MDLLPFELFQLIQTFMSVKTLVTLSMVDKKLETKCNANECWKDRYYRLNVSVCKNKDYKSLYKIGFGQSLLKKNEWTEQDTQELNQIELTLDKLKSRRLNIIRKRMMNKRLRVLFSV
tara:strand:+ start:390 stop:743 length:354 start_codon:yes stop_codon:yes gene_type:complete